MPTGRKSRKRAFPKLLRALLALRRWTPSPRTNHSPGAPRCERPIQMRCPHRSNERGLHQPRRPQRSTAIPATEKRARPGGKDDEAEASILPQRGLIFDDLTFSPDGQLVALEGKFRRSKRDVIRVVDIQSRAKRLDLRPPGPVSAKLRSHLIAACWPRPWGERLVSGT